MTTHLISEGFLDRASGLRTSEMDGSMLSVSLKAREIGLRWLQAMHDSGLFKDANFLDLAERERMLDWLDEQGMIEAELPEREHYPGARRDAASFTLAYYATQMQVILDDEALRCFDTDAAAIPTYHRGTVIE